MWVEETKTGKFKFIEQYTDYMTEKKKRISVTLSKNTASTRKTAATILVKMIENQLVDTPKTLCSIRDVYMQSELEKVCKNILLYTKLNSIAAGYRTKLFIPSQGGNYICYGLYNKYLRENSQKALNRSVTAHALRHTHASILLAQRISVDTISRRLGHENSKVTRESYLHVTEKLVKKDNEQIQTAHII